MKKLLALAMMVVLVLSLASCSALPEGGFKAVGDSIVSSIKGEHVHTYFTVSHSEGDCETEGKIVQICWCFDVQETVIPGEHDFVRAGGKEPTCVNGGTLKFKCSRCGKTDTQKVGPTGHNLESSEPSRGAVCTNPKCPYFVLPAPIDPKYADALTFTFGDAEKAALDAVHASLAELLASAEKYDPAKHAYVEEGALADAYAEAEAIYEEYNDLIWAARDQYSVAMTLYYVNIESDELEKTYNDMMEFYNGLVAKFYELSQPWYDSMFREYYYYGMTDEEINAFLFDSSAISNPRYTELKNRNDAIELEYRALENTSVPKDLKDDEVAKLYAEFVQNANEMAEIMGYDNYLEYAYENVYSREYSPEDVAAFLEYVKTYLVPAFNNMYKTYKSLSLDQSDYAGYYTCTQDSFFDKVDANIVFNDFIDDMEMGFTTNPDKIYSFSDELNNLVSDGNLFRGTYEGAYVTYLNNAGIPIAYFGAGNNNIFTVAHEFGHFMNEIYNESQYDQSYDLLEVHSQGHESLLLAYIEQEKLFSGSVLKVASTEQMLNNLFIIVCALQVDTFEQAIYLDYYDGYGSEEIMADGTITYDEYQTLYEYIAEDFGIADDYQNNEYWRHGMTITSPCYYVSYSVSAVNALQIYMMASTDGLDTAKDSYLKLITYTDVDPSYDMNQVLEYAGLASYMDEELYKDLAEFFATK